MVWESSRLKHDLDHFIISREDGVILHSEHDWRGGNSPRNHYRRPAQNRILHGMEILMCHKWPVRQLSGEGCHIPGENFYKALETSKRGQYSVWVNGAINGGLPPCRICNHLMCIMWCDVWLYPAQRYAMRTYHFLQNHMGVRTSCCERDLQHVTLICISRACCLTPALCSVG